MSSKLTNLFKSTEAIEEFLIEILSPLSFNSYSLTCKMLELSWLSICFVIRTIESSMFPKRIFSFNDEQLLEVGEKSFFGLGVFGVEFEELNVRLNSS